MSILAIIQDAARNSRQAEAESMLRNFLSDIFSLPISRVEVRQDTLSLNSVNGFIHLDKPDEKSGATLLFFKFHHEENEEGLKEYYNSALLEENGYPVEMPVYASHEVGKQVLLYPFKSSERMADLCKRLDSASPSDENFKNAVEAQRRLDRLVASRYAATLHQAPLDKIHDETVMQLFHHRLTDDRGHTMGGRYRQFYADKVCELPGQSIIRYDDLAGLTWRINGLAYDHTLHDAFLQAFTLLAPINHAFPDDGEYPAVVAHGDAHNGNVWYNTGDSPFLSLFDPAFAGPHTPALLAEIKPTFHNIFAHPLWLYDAQEADKKIEISFHIENGVIAVEHNWELSPLRREFLACKRDEVWKPLITLLRERKLLPPHWQHYMRSALFCCPTLVMNLRAHAGSAANSHTPKTSLLGWSTAMMLASAPKHGDDAVSEFFSQLN